MLACDRCNATFESDLQEQMMVFLSDVPTLCGSCSADLHREADACPEQLTVSEEGRHWGSPCRLTFGHHGDCEPAVTLEMVKQTDP